MNNIDLKHEIFKIKMNGGIFFPKEIMGEYHPSRPIGSFYVEFNPVPYYFVYDGELCYVLPNTLITILIVEKMNVVQINDEIFYLDRMVPM